MRHTIVGGLGFICVASSAHAGSLSGLPDLAQDRFSWTNYCAPTTGADLAYYYSQVYSSLVPGNTASDADTVIGDMATRMGTTFSGGTTVNGLVGGLDSYLEDNWDSITGGTHWNTQYLDGSTLGGAGLFNAVDNAINAGDGVILLIAWNSGLPTDPVYHTPDGYDGSTGVTDPIGHALALNSTTPGPTNFIGVNDPANNAGTHSFTAENAPYGLTINAFDWTLNTPMGGATATVYGAVTTSIPTPGAVVLLGCAGLVCGARRRARTACEHPQGTRP
ncbi:MAG: hypothetical protein ACF8GE_11970 [Phycisphaerales bacterium JB043]